MSKDQIEWDRWHCPHPDCEDCRPYDDPESVTETVCDRNHSIRLVWRDGKVSPRLQERISRHRWRPFFDFWVCIRLIAARERDCRCLAAWARTRKRIDLAPVA